MTSIIEAKNGMKEIAAKALAVTKDDSLTNAEKMTNLDALTLESKGFSDSISIHEAANRLLSGGEASAESKSEERSETRGFARQVVESSGYKAMRSGVTQFSQIEVKVATTIDEGIIPAFSGGSGLAGQLNIRTKPRD